MAAELSNQVYTAPQAPDYLGHYAELLKSIPNYGLQFLAAQKAGAENAKAMQEYELMKQKAKAFLELYPAFKAAQIAKLQGEAGTFPYKQALLQEQAALARARAAGLTPPAGGSDNPFGDIVVPTAPGTPTQKAPALNPNAPPPPPLATAPTTPSPTGGVPLLDIAAGNGESSEG